MKHTPAWTFDEMIITALTWRPSIWCQLNQAMFVYSKDYVWKSGLSMPHGKSGFFFLAEGKKGSNFVCFLDNFGAHFFTIVLFNWFHNTNETRAISHWRRIAQVNLDLAYSMETGGGSGVGGWQSVCVKCNDPVIVLSFFHSVLS